MTLRIATTSAAALCLCAGAHAQIGFQDIGPLAQAFSVNNDGSAIAGRLPSALVTAHNEACRWDAGVPGGLGFLPSTDDSIAFGVSGDGSVMVGSSGLSTYDYGTAFRYSNGVMQNLGLLGGGTEYSIANGVSQNGNVIVGEGDTPFFLTMAWRKVGTGPLQEIGPFPGGTDCWAMDASSTGAVICGSGYNSLDLLQAFRWSNGTMTALPFPANAVESHAFGVSADGQTIVGSVYFPTVYSEQPVRWVGTTPHLLPVPSTHTGGVGYATSADGATVVGTLWLDDVFPEAMLWTSTTGTLVLKDVLTGNGITIPQGWTLVQAWDVSPDGRVIVGNAVDGLGESQAFSVTLYGPPVRSPCGPSDFNGDGASGLDDDIEAFFLCLGGFCCPTCWQNGADFNGDGASGQDDDIEAFFLVLGGGAC